jgi:glycosyltransferase involved in cell wall biosynthesis
MAPGQYRGLCLAVDPLRNLSGRDPAPGQTPDVLHLLWSGRIGGIERQVAAIARYGRSEKAGHRVCFLDGRGPVGDALVAEGLADRLRLAVGWDPVGLWRLARLLRSLHPDVVHSHTHALLPTLVARLALTRAAMVYTEHSPRALAPDRKFRVLYWILCRSVSRFIALSASMARAMEGYGASRARIRLIPNLSSTPHRPEAPEDRRTPTVGIVARLEDQKRVDLLIDVLAEIRRRGINCLGLIVGGGTRHAALVEHAGRMGLGQLIEFAGEQADVLPWLDRMDVFLMTSAVEPFGIAALEAMARKVPVLAMPCPGGLSDVVARGGLLLPDRSVTAAADAVVALLQSPDMRHALRTRGDAIASEHTPERIFPQLERLYRETRA